MQLKNLLITLLVLTSFSASAQINKGSIYLGGNLNFYTSKNNSQKSSNFSVSPAFGFAVRENLIVGLDVIYGHAETRYENGRGEWIQRNAGGGLFLRKYAPLGKGFYLFGQGRVGASFTNHQYEGANANDDGKGFGIDLSIFPGIAYSVNKKLQLELGLPNVFNVSYGNTKYTPHSGGASYKNTGFSASSSVSSFANSLTVGVRLFLQKTRT
jgi:hypothetical protein